MRTALLQMTSGIDPAANARAITDAMAEAKRQGADMLFTPEMAGYLDRDRARATTTLTGEGDDITLSAVREAAAATGLWVHIGSLALKDERSDGRWANRSFVIDGSGEIRARYDKIHLFDVDLPTGESWRESSVYGPGEQAVAVDTPWARLGLSICYDMRFPDLYRALSNAGATILAVPAAFTVPTGAAHWHVLLRARAIEAGAFVIAPAQAGEHADGRSTYGHSLIVDPWGEILCDLGREAEGGEAGGGEAGLAVVEMDLGRVDEVRARVPVLAHRRPIAAEVALFPERRP